MGQTGTKLGRCDMMALEISTRGPVRKTAGSEVVVRCAGWFLVLAALAQASKAGEVRILDTTGTQHFATIQAAVDAAQDGDILLIGKGSYTGFRITDKSLAIFALEAGTVLVNGEVAVADLSDHRAVVLSGLSSASGDFGASLRVSNCGGHVRVQDCQFLRGYNQSVSGQCYSVPALSDAALGATDSARIACVRSSFRGGEGFSDSFVGETGSHGVHSISSNIALYDCSVTGGKGGDTDDFDVCAGSGGAGISVASSSPPHWLFASGCTLGGGHGGYSGDCHIGSGGPAVAVGPGGTCLVLGSSCTGGWGGWGGGCWGPQAAAVQTSGNGVFGDFMLPARKLSSIETVIGHGPLDFEVLAPGGAGDRVYLAHNLRLGFLPSFVVKGVWLVPFPALITYAPQGVVPASEKLPLSCTFAPLPSGQAGLVRELQLVILRSQGGMQLGSFHHLLQLNPSAGPDCNANGIQDYVDILEGASSDANGNLVPDECDLPD